MRGGAMVREARRRAGLRQAELAARLDTTQSAIARIERGRTEPSFERVVDAVRACGFELVTGLRAADDSDWSVASANRQLTVEQRVQQHQADIRFVHAARQTASHG